MNLLSSLGSLWTGRGFFCDEVGSGRIENQDTRDGTPSSKGKERMNDNRDNVALESITPRALREYPNSIRGKGHRKER